VSCSNDFLLKITPKRKSILFVYVRFGPRDVFMWSVRIKRGVTSVLENLIQRGNNTTVGCLNYTYANFILSQKTTHVRLRSDSLQFLSLARCTFGVNDQLRYCRGTLILCQIIRSTYIHAQLHL
jgi:hypothetical protein